ncbi:hypothetical protein [Aeoliella sp.]|uniref:hypothetical protein n=1 Tax=Aeoliella sp. TaxID=2795800 RepID=UPI003CCB88CF
MNKLCYPLMLVMLAALPSYAAEEEPTPATSVGMPATIEEQVLPGPELEVKPLEDRDAPFVLRIVELFPHGSSHRYTFEYYALEPGEYNLTDYLQPIGGAEPAELPDFLVTVKPILPPGQVEPNALEPAGLPHLGWYWLWVVLGAILWLAAGYAILFVGRKKPVDAQAAEQAQPKTLADRLRPAIEAAVAGRLSEPELAQLERGLFAFWRDRLGLNDLTAAEAMRRVLDHPEGGQLVRQLEAWLHQPESNGDVDVASLLAPYRNMPADAMTEEIGSQEAVGA